MYHTHGEGKSGSARLVLVTAVLAFAIAFLCASNCRPIRNLLNVRVVEIETGPDVQIRPALAESRSEGEAFDNIIERLQPYAAINGTYYDHDMKPLGDLLIDGRLANRGCYRNALAVTSEGKIAFIHRSKGRLRWKGYIAGIAAGPRLVHKGRIALDPVADGFSPKSLNVRAWRSGVGQTATGKLLLVTARESLTLGEFARLMLDEGSVEAMNLDGGGACALYSQGKVLSTPSLPMTNVLLVYKKHTGL